MPAITPVRRVPVHAVAVLLAVGTAGCSGALDPVGSGADASFSLTVLMVVLGTVVYLGVLVALWWSLAGSRDEDEEERATGRRLMVWGGVALPAVVLPVVFAANIVAVVGQPSGQDVVIEVAGNQFWWEVHYPDAQFTTANEIHIPADTDVELRLSSNDVIHSFWVPQVSGKRDLIPGYTTTLVLHAEDPGTYRGQCAEFCGLQHANMRLRVIAHEPADFESWLEGWSTPDEPELTSTEQHGYELFEELTCAACHAIAGTPYDGQLGPALTDMYTRDSLGAGTVDLTRENLGQWVVDAQTIKPGAEMPPIDADDADLDALLDYLETLQ